LVFISEFSSHTAADSKKIHQTKNKCIHFGKKKKIQAFWETQYINTGTAHTCQSVHFSRHTTDDWDGMSLYVTLLGLFTLAINQQALG
jgi:hypothetical protein